SRSPRHRRSQIGWHVARHRHFGSPRSCHRRILRRGSSLNVGLRTMITQMKWHLRRCGLIMEGVHCMTTPVSPQQQVTQLLCQWRDGDPQALEKLMRLVQPELQRLAHHYMSRERPGHTLQTTALLDDAYLQLAGKSHLQWENRTHFFAVAAQLMRRIMVDH